MYRPSKLAALMLMPVEVASPTPRPNEEAVPNDVSDDVAVMMHQPSKLASPRPSAWVPRLRPGDKAMPMPRLSARAAPNEVRVVAVRADCNERSEWGGCAIAEREGVAEQEGRTGAWAEREDRAERSERGDCADASAE
jgi:hypothetical protein